MLSSRLQHQFIEVFTVPPKILFIICDKLFLTPTAALHTPSPPKKKKKSNKKIIQAIKKCTKRSMYYEGAKGHEPRVLLLGAANKDREK